MDLRYLDDHEWCDLVCSQSRPSLDDFVNMFAEEEIGGTSRVTDVEGWALLERNSVQKFFFKKYSMNGHFGQMSYFFVSELFSFFFAAHSKKRRYPSWFISF